MIESDASVLSRTEKIVGRDEELQRLRTYLYARGERHYVYLYGDGGVGKTRLLEAVREMVDEAGEGFYSTGILDLFHTDTHSTSDVERIIIEALDPHQRYFRRYREARKGYETVRERGTDPQILERRRVELSQYFVDGCREMALDAHKLVLLFDTVELLQYESSVVEQVAGLDMVDARIKAWLLKNLAKLGNVLVVFAGRPKLPAPGETRDPQERLLGDMRAAFGDDFDPRPIGPLSETETHDLIRVLGAGKDLIPERLLPVVHLLTGGRPVYVHLVVDLLVTLADVPTDILSMFEGYSGLVGKLADDLEVKAAKSEIEKVILEGVFNEETHIGWHLDRLAMMPKGVDAEILTEAVGMPRAEAEDLLKELEPLSFVKTYRPPQTGDTQSSRYVLPGRIFLHDELYRMLRSTVTRNWRYMELQVAHGLVRNYYDPHIADLQRQIDALELPEERIPLRERMQKLEVERLYYMLVCDASLGYAEYKRLTEGANWWRWVGYSNRLLDEFLRYYNDEQRRPEFARKGLDEKTILRESAVLWSERFYWWGQYQRCVEFATHVLTEHPDIVPPTDAIARATILARKLDSVAMLSGYDPQVADEGQSALTALPQPADCDLEQLLARARLAGGLGYQYQQGGMLVEAVSCYEEAKTCFRELEAYTVAYRGELAIWLHSLAYADALQGRMLLAMPLAREALKINESLKYEYATGLTLSALSGIERRRGLYEQAAHHAEEARDIFQRLEDPHGTALAYAKIVQARRTYAKTLIANGRRLEEAQQILEKECLVMVSHGVDVARTNQLASLRDLLAEQGRVYRDLGHVRVRRFGITEGLQSYHQAATSLREALGSGQRRASLPVVVEADIRQDLAEVLYFSEDVAGAEQEMGKVLALTGDTYVIEPGKRLPAPDLPVDRFAPLGKVELLRGQMILSKATVETSAQDLAIGLRHFVLAYAYFLRFSAEAIEKDTMITYAYNSLSPASAVTCRAVIAELRTWAQSNSLGVDVDEFLDVLANLLN